MTEGEKRVNSVLRCAMKEIYKARRQLSRNEITHVRSEIVNDRAFCEIWFMTAGCSHDAQGGCTMCNYGKGFEADWNEVLDELELQIRSLPAELQELIVTPTGSMLDDDEVPAFVRDRIYQRLQNIKCCDFIIETRLDTITEEKLLHLKNSIRAEHIFVEVGMECCDDWVLRNCVNKNITVADLEEGIRLIHACGMSACVNIGLGIPFLSERYSINLASASIRQAFAAEADSVVLFPYHVKPGTLSAWLWERELYHCCSLWALVEVLSRFAPEELERIQISWYRNYYKDPSKILSSPNAGENTEHILRLLDAYKNHPGLKALQPLLDDTSDERRIWKQKIESQSLGIALDRIQEIYRMLSETFHIPPEKLECEWAYMKKTYRGNKNAASI